MSAAAPPPPASPAALFICDPLDSLAYAKDTSVGLMAALLAKGWSAHYLDPAHLWIDQGRAMGRVQALANVHPAKGTPTERAHLSAAEAAECALDSFDLALARFDPPVDSGYLKITWLLDFVNQRTPVFNPPEALRAHNEKLAALHFGQTPPTIVSADRRRLVEFAGAHDKIVIKPMNAMGGQRVYVLARGDSNLGVLLDDLLIRERALIAQAYQPAIETEGDLRVVVIDGEPLDTGLARRPAEGDHRGNLLARAEASLRPLNDSQRRLSRRIGQWCRARRIPFAGLDFIGDALTEINITSPTCVREMENLGIAGISGRIADAHIAYAQAASGKRPGP